MSNNSMVIESALSKEATNSQIPQRSFLIRIEISAECYEFADVLVWIFLNSSTDSFLLCL